MTKEPEIYTLKYTLDEPLFMRGCHALWAYRAIGRGGNFAIASVVLACAIVLFWLDVPGPVAPLLLAGAVVIVVMDLLRDLLWRRQFRKTALRRGEFTVKISEKGVTFGLLKDAVQRPWKAFQSFARTDEFLFIIIDQRRFIMIPVDSFSTTQDAAGCEAVLITHLRRLPRRFF